MKTLAIGETTLELKDFAKKWDKIAGVYAIITIPTTAISHDDLKALFTGNQNDLIVTKEDGSTETFSGYSELHSIVENIADGTYVVTQYCTSTALHLLNEARKQIETLEQEKTDLQNTVKAQGSELQTHAKIIVSQNEQLVTQAQTITEQGNTIALQSKSLEEQQAIITEQNEKITEQAEAIDAQIEEIAILNDTLLEVLMG